MIPQSDEELAKYFQARVTTEKASIEQLNLTPEQLLQHLAVMRALSKELNAIVEEQSKSMFEASRELTRLGNPP